MLSFERHLHALLVVCLLLLRPPRCLVGRNVRLAFGRSGFDPKFYLFEFIVPVENFSPKWKLHNCPCRAANQTYARHSSSLSSKRTLPAQTYSNTGHPFIVANLYNPCHSHLLPSVWEWSKRYFGYIKIMHGLENKESRKRLYAFLCFDCTSVNVKQFQIYF